MKYKIKRPIQRHVTTIPDVTTKVCGKCNYTFPLSSFSSWERNGKTIYRKECKQCFALYQKQRRNVTTLKSPNVTTTKEMM